jgi:hypothetical protein
MIKRDDKANINHNIPKGIDIALLLTAPPGNLGS